MDQLPLPPSYVNPNSPLEKSFLERHTWVKTLAIGILISQIGVAIAVLGYILWYHAKKTEPSPKQVITKTPTVTYSPTPVASSSALPLSTVVPTFFFWAGHPTDSIKFPQLTPTIIILKKLLSQRL